LPARHRGTGATSTIPSWNACSWPSGRELDPAKRREIVLDIQRYLADKAYYVYLPMWPRYIVHPAYVKGFRNHDGFGLGSRLMYTWFDR
jgi:hypothetical protein